MGMKIAMSPPIPIVRINRTENTIVEIRAQFFSRNNPMLVAIPQAPIPPYIARLMIAITVKNCGETPGVWVGRCGPSSMAAEVSTPTSSISVDPITANTATTVTPAERFITPLSLV